jgi:pyruvate kinase
MSRVKIVATVGPRTESAESLQLLGEVGVDVIRLNGSHATLEWHSAAIARIRHVLPHVPILFDLPGSKIRTASMDGEIAIAAGDEIVLTSDPTPRGSRHVVVDSSTFHGALSRGDVLLVDDGMLRLTVRDVTGEDVVCVAENSAGLKGRKGVQMQGAALRGEFMGANDRRLLAFAVRYGVDFVGLSFVERASEIDTARLLAGKDGPRLIAKIETAQAVDNLDSILDAADAVMVDRGDLSVETSLERVALLQKQVLARARRAARPVIIATQMLHSMTRSPIPTQAEVSDITNAVLDGAAALMLSGETAVGDYPTEAVSLMRRVAASASSQLDTSKMPSAQMAESIPHAVADAIALLCQRLPITKIVVITISGFAARMVAATQPRQPVLAVSNDAVAARGFNLLPGTRGIHVDVPFAKTTLAHVPQVLEALWRRSELNDDDTILVTTVGYPRSGNRMNLIETHRVSDLRDTLGWS